MLTGESFDFFCFFPSRVWRYSKRSRARQGNTLDGNGLHTEEQEPASIVVRICTGEMEKDAKYLQEMRAIPPLCPCVVCCREERGRVATELDPCQKMWVQVPWKTRVASFLAVKYQTLKYAMYTT